MSFSRPPMPAATAQAVPASFDPLPPGLPNRLSDGSVIIATLHDREFQSWLIRTALGEFAKLVVYSSRARLEATLVCFEKDQAGRVNQAEAARVKALDRAPRPRKPKSAARALSQDHIPDTEKMIGVDLVTARGAQ